jgi:hypothetical protein
MGFFAAGLGISKSRITDFDQGWPADFGIDEAGQRLLPGKTS